MFRLDDTDADIDANGLQTHFLGVGISQCEHSITCLDCRDDTFEKTVADPRGAPPAHASPFTDQNFLNFMQFFWENLVNLYVGAPSWRVGAPSYEESWIRP